MDFTKEQIKQIISQISKDSELKKQFNTALGQPSETKSKERSSNLEDAKKELEIEIQRAAVLKETAEAMNDIVQLEKERSKEQQLKTELALRQEIEEVERAGEAARLAGNENEAIEIEKKQKALEEILDNVREGQEISNAQALTNYEINDGLREQLGIYEKVVLKYEQYNRLQEKEKGNIKDFVSSLGSAVGLQDKISDGFINNFVEISKTLAKGGDAADGYVEGLREHLASMFSIQNIAFNLGSKIFKESMKVLEAFDKASASLAAQTGTVGKFNDVLYNTQRAGNLLGVSMEDAANSIITLNAQTSMFASLSKSVQTDLAITTSQFEKLGVSSQDTALFMENAFKIMNMGAEEAIVVQKELAMAGVELGIGAGKIIKDFNAASKTLAVYGKESIKIFKGVAAAAKAANVEVSTLMGMVERYDTFAGAAEGSAKLNALLGTQLSTTEMLMMTEDERVKTLVESVQAQGVAFSDMDKYTQKAIAAAAGISDMNEANRIFGMSLGQFEAHRREMEKNAEAQQKFDDAVQATVPVMQKFENLATEMIIMVQPALETLGEIADYLTDFFQGMNKETKEFVGTFALITSGILVLAPLFTVGSGFLAGLAAIGPAIGGIGTGVAAAAAALTGVASTGVGALVLGGLMAAGAGLAATIAAVALSKAEIAKANAEIVSEGSRTINSLADISQADFSGIATNFAGVMNELQDISNDTKVVSVLQNLSMINSGTAVSLTGAKITSSATNVTAKVSNFFEGMTMTLKTGAGQEFEAYVETIAAKTAVT